MLPCTQLIWREREEWLVYKMSFIENIQGKVTTLDIVAPFGT